MDEELKDLRKEISGVKTSIADLELGVKTTLTALETNVKAVFKRIDEQRTSHDAVRELTSTADKLRYRVDGLEKTIIRLEQSVDEVKAKPARRWEAVTGQIVNLLIVAFLGYIMTKIGLQ